MAKENIETSLKMTKKLVEINEDKYSFSYALHLFNLGLVYKYLNRYHESENSYLKSLDIYERLEKKNPGVHSYYLAINLNELGNLYSMSLSFK